MKTKRPEIPLEIKRRLRREVNYGCPFPNCGKPFLEFHHFNPRWSAGHQHRQEGMIALCPDHHRMADNISDEQLYEMKKNPHNTHPTGGAFEWLYQDCIIRVSGCYALGSCSIRVGGLEVFRIFRRRDEVVSVNFQISDQDGSTTISMFDNCLNEFPLEVHDFEVSADRNRIRVWRSERDIGFDFRVSRVTPYKLMEIIDKDLAATRRAPLPDPRITRRIPKPIGNIDQFYERLRKVSDQPEAFAVGFQRDDPIGTQVHWFAARHLSGDRKIPLFDLRNAKLYGDSSSFKIAEGTLVASSNQSMMFARSCVFSTIEASAYGLKLS